MSLSKVENKIYDSGVHLTCTVNELANLIIQMTGSTSGTLHLPMREGEDEGITVPSIETFARNTSPKITSLENGIKSTIEYFRSIPRAQIEFALRFYYGSDEDNNLKMTYQALSKSPY